MWLLKVNRLYLNIKVKQRFDGTLIYVSTVLWFYLSKTFWARVPWVFIFPEDFNRTIVYWNSSPHFFLCQSNLSLLKTTIQKMGRVQLFLVMV